MPDESALSSTTSTTIDTTTNLVTLINVFTVAPKHQQKLVDLLADTTTRIMHNLPGFVSANIHRSLDGHHVANYAQWQTKADFEAMLQHPDAQSHMQQAATLATYEPVLYEVAFVDRA